MARSIKDSIIAAINAMADLAAPAANQFIYFTSASAAAYSSVSSVARTLLAQTTQSLMLTTGLGLSANGQSLVTAADYTAMRVLLAVWYVLGKSAATGMSHTGNTNETTLATITIPANALGANGRIRVTTQWTYTNNANTKTLIVRLGGTSGTQYATVAVTTTAGVRMQQEIANRNATNSQIGFAANNSSGFGGTTAAPVTSAVDTTASVDLVIRCQLGNGADTITLDSYCVEILKSA